MSLPADTTIKHVVAQAAAQGRHARPSTDWRIITSGSVVTDLSHSLPTKFPHLIVLPPLPSERTPLSNLLRLVYRLSSSTIDDIDDIDLIFFCENDKNKPLQLMYRCASDLIHPLRLFAMSVHAGSPCTPWRSDPNDLEILKSFMCLCTEENERMHVRWYDVFGCALVVHRDYLSPYARFVLIAIDDWRIQVQSNSSARIPTRNSPRCSYTPFEIGSVPHALVKDVLQETDVVLGITALSGTSIQSGKISTRGARRGPHQRTSPTSVWSAVTQALVSVVGSSMPSSSLMSTSTTTPAPEECPVYFADAPRMPNSDTRHLAWPLLQAVMHYFFDTQVAPTGGLVEMFVAQFRMHIAERAVSTLFSREVQLENVGRADIQRIVNGIMLILRDIASDFPILCRTGSWKYELLALQARIVVMRHDLESLSAARILCGAKLSKLIVPSVDTAKLREIRLNLPNRQAPGLITTQDEGKTRQNLALTLKPLDKTTKLEELNRWMNLSAMFYDDSDHMRYSVCSMVESTFCTIAVNGFSGLCFDDVTIIDEILKSYRQLRNVLRNTDKPDILPKTESDSKEVVTVWIAYCMVHFIMVCEVPIIVQYSIPLDPKLLRHLVLSDSLAVEAVFALTEYIYKYRRNEQYFFSQLPTDNTMAFAFDVASSTQVLMDVWNTEREAAEARVARRWEHIRQRQALLATLDAQMHQLSLELRDCELEVDMTLPIRSYGPMLTTPQNNALRAAANNKRKQKLLQVNQKRAEIMEVEGAPEPLFQPLPSSEQEALAIIFFLFMSPQFDVFSRLSFVAQSLLLPKESNVELALSPSLTKVYNLADALRQKAPETKWADYYERNCGLYRIKGSGIILGSTLKVQRGSHWYPNNVRGFTSEFDGVWFPDSLKPNMFWAGGVCELDKFQGRGRHYLNPFAWVPPDVFLIRFLAQLPEESSTLQWALTVSDNSSSRDNEAIANQQMRPTWMRNKNQLFAYTSLRASPVLQLRKLTACLAEDSLKLENESVYLLIHQTLNQVGPINAEGDPQRLWWKDVDLSNGVDELIRQLSRVIEDLRGKPRDHSKLPTLSLLTKFVSYHSEDGKMVVRNLAGIAESWADTLAEDEKEVDNDNVSLIRARRSLFYRYSILVLASGNIKFTSQDASSLCRCILLAAKTRVYGNECAYDYELRRLSLMIAEILPSRLVELCEVVSTHQDSLTYAVKSVHEGAPSNLEWELYPALDGIDTCAFWCEVGASKYCVNLQNGIFLVNGNPLTRLPHVITSNPMYKRTFGDRNFDVLFKKDGVMATSTRIDGRFYEFITDPELKSLSIRESGYDDMSQALELLDGTKEGLSTWGRDLPRRLREMHSHWLSSKRNVIVLRPVCFKERRVDFILYRCDKKVESESTTYWSCYKVPGHVNETYQQIELHGTERLKAIFKVENLKDSNVVTILGRMEKDRDSIYVMVKDGFFSFELPRFALQFDVQSDGTLCCETFSGWRVSQEQQLDGTLPEFHSYIIIESGQHRKVLMPAGSVKTIRRSVSIQLPKSEVQDFYVFEIHPRFGTIEPSGGKRAIEARLQLAALYAASSTRLPESGSKMTGAERAIDLLRQCWTNQPMSKAETAHLRSVLAHAYISPGLTIMCHELLSSSHGLGFLFGVTEKNDLAVDLNAWTEYRIRKSFGFLNPREYLTEDEELFNVGTTVSCSSPLRNGKSSLSVDIPEEAIPCIADIEAKMTSLLVRQENVVDFVEFPLQGFGLESSRIGKEMLEQAESSWYSFKNLCSMQLNSSIEDVLPTIQDLHTTCRERLSSIEELITGTINTCVGDSDRAICFWALRAANLVPNVTLRDFVRAACDPSVLLDFNPFLSPSSRRRLSDCILRWMELCVLDDKLSRTLDLCKLGKKEEVTLELREPARKWSVREYPEWLTFEVEKRLQIRYLQYCVTNFCMENPGKITQLNMGEGKTRVIIPLLMLAMPHANRLMRLHFLSPLLMEGYNFLHHTLTASVLNRRLYLLPFHRSISLGDVEVSTLRYHLQRCMRTKGAVCVAPEHRLSLELKWFEMRISAGNDEDAASNTVLMDLQQIYGLPYCDVFDESDELLSHKYQLIYAVGECTELPAGQVRWAACQGVLHQIQRSDDLMKAMPFVRRTPHSTRGAGSFDDILLLDGMDFEVGSMKLMKLIAQKVLNDPPYIMSWMKDHPYRKEFLVFISNPEVTVDWLKAKVEAKGDSTDFLFNSDRLDALLALRGILAFGLIILCLRRRYRVEYGIDPRRGLGRRVAVPFRASDTPSERSEYAHPDALIMYTQLAYYYKGLTLTEFKEAIIALLSLGKIAQRKTYKVWFDSGNQSMTDEHRLELCRVEKVDPTNEALMAIMHGIYQFNMAVIDFWLETCVFPRETAQFAGKIGANAFHIAKNMRGDIVGFSGTKDTQLLLPAQVSQQAVPQLDDVQATDGKMIDLIMRNDNVISVGKDEGVLVSQGILKGVVEHGVHALIDAGACMAGMSNWQVAQAIIDVVRQQGEHDEGAMAVRLGGGRLKGVVFYDAAECTWIVSDWEGRKWALGSSPIHERDAFVYFDENHCRGADMNLCDDACALVTIGPGMCKDKLMQAAGRMRKLDRGQSLIFALPAELLQNVIYCKRDVQSPNKKWSEGNEKWAMKDVLRWIMANTIETVGSALVEWGKQGSYFCTTGEDASIRIVNSVNTLGSMYGTSIKTQSVTNLVQQVIDRDQKRTPSVSANRKKARDEMSLLKKILNHTHTYGSDVKVRRSEADEECEREFEHEREKELEQEAEVGVQEPCESVDWDISRVVHCSAPWELDSAAGARHLKDVLKRGKCWASRLDLIDWSLCQVYVTRNFMTTVAGMNNDLAGHERLDRYLDDRSGTMDVMDFFADVRSTHSSEGIDQDYQLNYNKDVDYNDGCTVDVGDFLRPVDSVVMFEPTKTFLLVSEQEAGRIVEVLWRIAENGEADNLDDLKVKMVTFWTFMGVDCINLSKWWHSSDRDECDDYDGDNGNGSNEGCTRDDKWEQSLVGLRLFAGCTTFKTRRSRKVLREMVRRHGAKESALKLVHLRGMGDMISRSDLEVVCRVDD